MSLVTPDDDDMSFKSDILSPKEMNEYIKSNTTPVKKKSSIFPPDSILPTFLKEVLGVEIDFLDRLQEMGCTTPAQVINSFGRDPKAIAISFMKLAPAYVLSQKHYKSSTMLVMFCRYHILQGYFTKPETKQNSWHKLRVIEDFLPETEIFSDAAMKNYDIFFNDIPIITKAAKEMRQICNIVRYFIKTKQTAKIYRKDISGMQSQKTPKVITPISQPSTPGSNKLTTWSPEVVPQTPSYNWTPETPTPFKNIIKTDQLDDILQQL